MRWIGRKWYRLVVVTGVVSVVLTLTGLWLFLAFHTVPEGVWGPDAPQNRQSIMDIVHFSAQAYPTNHNDPAIDFVVFTVKISGAWHIACISTQQSELVQGIALYACSSDLGEWTTVNTYYQIIATFTVYNQSGNRSVAPNGERIFTFYRTS